MIEQFDFHSEQDHKIGRMQQFIYAHRGLPLSRQIGVRMTRRPKVLITCVAGLFVALIVFVSLSSSSKANVGSARDGGVSIESTTRAMVTESTISNDESDGSAISSLPAILSAVTPNGDPGTRRILHDSITKVTDLINSYRQNGLSNLPNLPNLPGLNTIMRVPDKLLRAELSMLQDEIRMAQDMMQNPMSATMNAPRDLATMLQRMAQQLEQ